jgi:subtilisin family serine protease
VSQLHDMSQMSQVKQVFEYHPENKICSSVYKEDEEDNNIAWNILTVVLFNNVPNGIEQQLKSLLDINAIEYKSLARTSDNIIIVFVSKDDTSRSAELLASQPIIQWIERDLPEDQAVPETKHGSWVIQSSQESRTPFTDAGLTGKGQVIAVADSGVDVNSCYFYDPDNPVPYYNDSVAPIVEHSSKHRKIEIYYTFMDGLDNEDGHGTHVSGIAAGNFKNMNQNHTSTAIAPQYNGIAPDAKLAFIDVGCQQDGGCYCPANTPNESCPCLKYKTGKCPNGGQLNLPTDLRLDYFAKTYAAGARIHSNSIGGSIGQPYNDKSIAIDEFIYKNDDFIIVWSTGNSGREVGLSTITGSFKQAKNNIVVGATSSAYQSWLEKYSEHEDFDIMTLIRRDELYTMFNCDCTRRDNTICTKIEKMSQQSACCSIMGTKCNLKLTGTLEATPKNPFRNLALDCCQSCALTELAKYKPMYDFQTISEFSSNGPAQDGRIKPDIVAPGQYIRSARGHGSNLVWQCSANNPDDDDFHMLYKAGTSMATPIVAAAAAITRQYFLEGFYKVNNQKVPFNPSAALVKAALIASARPLTEYAQLGSRFDELVPSVRRYYEGYGLLNLENVLPLGQNSSLYVEDRRPITSGVEHRYTVTHKDTRDFVVCLVWTDVPGAAFSSVNLVNDLDLLVEYEDAGEKQSIWGNAVDQSTNSADRLNNVEKVFIPADISKNTKFTIKVIGHNIPSGPQNYSLVVSGGSFNGEEVQSSLRIGKVSSNVPSETKSSQISIPIWLFTLMILLITIFFLTSVGSIGYYGARSYYVRRKINNAQNHEMLERFVSNYAFTDQ